MDEERKYVINIGDFAADGTIYPNRCLSASFGGQGVPSEVIPWDGTDSQPWDYKYDDGAFVLEPITLPEVVEEPTRLDIIEGAILELATLIAEVERNG